jgi:NADH:ubiquinone oxidoreductase subunit F (NADH-binding)
MTVSDVAPIITSRFANPDAHTLSGYRATGGYQALAKALSMSPEAVANEVKEASLLGRGGAGFPAGVKWGFCPPGVWPRYLVVNGDESEPGTYKDRMLMERDPHQLIEGVLLACYAVGCGQAFLYVRGEMALAQERIAAASGTISEQLWQVYRAMQINAAISADTATPEQRAELADLLVRAAYVDSVRRYGWTPEERKSVV